MAKYYGYTTMIDAQIGRILQTLEALDLDSEAVVLFTTDHGDHAGAHGGIHDKASMMYQETYHIPFIMRGPDIPPGRVINQPVTNMDILPTLLDLAGIGTERHMDGRSLCPLLNKGDTTDWEEDVMCQFNGNHFLYESRMVTDGKYKYVFNAPEIDELYDLERDPWEMQNLITTEGYRNQVAYMRSRLLYWAEKSEDPLLVWMQNLFAKRERTRPEDYVPYG